MAGARLTPLPPNSFYPCGLFGCMGQKGAYTLGRDGGHPDIYLCEHDARSLIMTTPGELLPVIAEMIGERLKSGGGAAKLLRDLLSPHFGGKVEPVPAGLPDVAAVVAEVTGGTEWGARLLDELSAALEAQDDQRPAGQTEAGANGVTDPEDNDTHTAAHQAAAAMVAGDDDHTPEGGAYSKIGDKFVCNGCGVEKDTERAMKLHVPHCKGPKKEAGAAE